MPVNFIDPDIWMTMEQAAEEWGCHYETVRRNFPRIPAEERLIHKQRYYIWKRTKYRPQNYIGRPYTSLNRKLYKSKVRKALPKLPLLTEIQPQQREYAIARIEAVLEPPPPAPTPLEPGASDTAKYLPGVRRY